MNALLRCLDSNSNNLFDFSIAPEFMYYSYVPIVCLLLFFSIFVYLKNRQKISILFLVISLLTSLWIILAIITWISTPVILIAFSWQILYIIDPLIYTFTFYFVFYSIFNTFPRFPFNIINFLFLLTLIISLPTELNFVSFDLLNCGNNDGSGWYLNYIYQLFILISILLIPVYKINRVSNKDDKYKILFISLSSFVFLFFFFVSNFFGDIFSLYEINLIGPVGMLVMVILLSFSISKYKLFNIKLLIPQILVAVLLFLNFAMLFAKDMWSAKLIIVVTLLVTFIIGYLLIRSVKKVDKQRELLEISNRNQQTLIHFITHQIKGFLTKSKGVFSMLQEGDYGVLPPEAEKIVGEGLKSDNKAVDMVQEILHASNLKNGTMTYNMSSVDISSMIKNIFEGFKDSAIKKGLIFELEANEEVKINGDSTQLENVFKNLIDNSIKYTQAGFVNVSLKKSDNKAIFEIADSGIGISESDRNRLFTEGGRGEESTKVNVESTGYGLFIVKKIIDEHKGKIDVESKGRNKGSKFRVELPLV